MAMSLGINRAEVLALKARRLTIRERVCEIHETLLDGASSLPSAWSHEKLSTQTVNET